MNTAIVYLLYRAGYTILDFSRHWYIGSARAIMHRTLGILERFDYSLALSVTLRSFFQPLYQDRSAIGYILGFFFRTIRIVIALLLYALIIAGALLLYLSWAALPVIIIYRGFFYYGADR